MSLQEIINKNWLELGLFVIFITYIILTILLFKHNPKNIINNYNSTSIITSIFGGFLLIMVILFIKKRDYDFFLDPNDKSKPSILSYLLKIFYTILIFGAIAIIIIGILYFMKKIPGLFSATIFIINILIIILLISFIITYFKNKTYLTTKKKSPLFNLLTNIILYIPCLVNNMIEKIKYEYKITPKTAYIILILEIILIILRILLPKIFNFIIKRDGICLLDDKINLNNENIIGEYSKLNPETINSSNKYNYNYAISMWINIDPQPMATNVSYSEDTNILNYGGKPAILYNAKKNILIFKEKNGNNDEIIFTTNNIPYQKWSNIIIN